MMILKVFPYCIPCMTTTRKEKNMSDIETLSDMCFDVDSLLQCRVCKSDNVAGWTIRKRGKQGKNKKWMVFLERSFMRDLEQKGTDHFWVLVSFIVCFSEVGSEGRWRDLRMTSAHVCDQNYSISQKKVSMLLEEYQLTSSSWTLSPPQSSHTIPQHTKNKV